MRAEPADTARLRAIPSRLPLIRLWSGPQTPSPQGGRLFCTGRLRAMAGLSPPVAAATAPSQRGPGPCLPLRDRLPRNGGDGACARRGAVAPQGRRERAVSLSEASGLGKALSPTACGRSPLPEGAKGNVIPAAAACRPVQRVPPLPFRPGAQQRRCRPAAAPARRAGGSSCGAAPPFCGSDP